MNTQLLAMTLRNKAAALRQVNVETSADNDLLRDAAELIRVLARLMDGAVPIKAFGPPGDWGYETEIGQALVALRSGTCAAAPASKQAGDEGHLHG